MADNTKGMIMGLPSCEWVHEWLPLLVGDGDGISGDDTNLSADDRGQIEHHLAECASCRQYRAALDDAVSILSISAAEMPAGLGAPSLWPRLEEQIQRHHEQSRSTWLRFLRAICPEGIRVAADRLYRGSGYLRSQLPLQLAWTRDSVHEFLASRAQFVTSSVRSDLGTPFRTATLRLGLGLSLAMAGMLVLMLVTVIQRQKVQAKAQIVAKAAPIPTMETPLAEPREESEDVVTAFSSSTDSRASDSLAQAEPAAPAEVPVTEQNTPAKTATTATTTTATTTSAPRYDFDLEHGTPMPPETRGGKPTY